MQCRLESPDQPDVIQLIADLDAYQDQLYPAESRYALDLSSLTQGNVHVAVARGQDGQALGCGALVVYEEYGELKRMYVAPAYRGRGVAQRVLALLEEAALASGCTVAMLETGPYQPQAINFYERSGYARCERFGDYRDDPLSVFMRKRLGTGTSAQR